jgi:hypothetical protein
MEIGGHNTMLGEFTKNGYGLERLKPYEDFLFECKQKDIESYAKHKHHILPVFMGGNNEPDNFILLTPEDHYKAHLILAECFEKGNPEHHFNISSANLIIRHAKRALKKVFGVNVPTDLFEFWKQANIYIKDAMKGESSYMFGKTHPEEWRKEHSRKMIGAGNSMYGRKNPHTAEVKAKLAEIGKELSKTRFPMPEGVFEGNEINGKKYWRYCPTCNVEIRHSRRDAAGRGHRDGLECKKCSTITGGSKLKGRKLSDTSHLKSLKKDYTNVGKYDKHGNKNPNAKQVLDPKTGKLYGTMKELSLELGVSVDVVRLKIKKGEYKYGNA